MVKPKQEKVFCLQTRQVLVRTIFNKLFDCLHVRLQVGKYKLEQTKLRLDQVKELSACVGLTLLLDLLSLAISCWMVKIKETVKYLASQVALHALSPKLEQVAQDR